MRYLALAVDYDGTAATDDRLTDSAAAAIERLRLSGRRAVLVTGRRIGDLLRVCPKIELFDLIVAENGAVLYDPRQRDEIPLASPLPPAFAERPRKRGVEPLEIGRVIVATHEPHGGVMLDVIRELGLELHVIFNRSAIMALPPGVNKGVGLQFALRKLGLSRHEAVAIGDAENHHSLLDYWAHHMLPQSWGHVSSVLPQKLGETILVTVHPNHVASSVLAPIDLVLAIGEAPESTLRKFADAAAHPLTWPQQLAYDQGKVVAWPVGDGELPFALEPQPCRAERIRHHRKYAEGNLRYHSFYFRGPNGRLNLRAQNLSIFSQIAEGLDEPTWMLHLRRNDYSRWFREAIKDEYLAQQTERIELRTDLTWLQSRHLIRELVGARYTLPE